MLPHVSRAVNSSKATADLCRKPSQLQDCVSTLCLNLPVRFLIAAVECPLLLAQNCCTSLLRAVLVVGPSWPFHHTAAARSPSTEACSKRFGNLESYLCLCQGCGGNSYSRDASTVPLQLCSCCLS
jgi:hypothetical protein